MSTIICLEKFTYIYFCVTGFRVKIDEFNAIHNSRHINFNFKDNKKNFLYIRRTHVLIHLFDWLTPKYFHIPYYRQNKQNHN